MERIKEFKLDGKNFIYFDLSNLKANGDFVKVIGPAKEILSKYEPDSVYTITNISNIMYDTETKNLVAEWVEHNMPYVKCGTVIGIDGIKKIMVNAVFKLSGRTNMRFFNTKEQAIEWMLEQQ